MLAVKRKAENTSCHIIDVLSSILPHHAAKPSYYIIWSKPQCPDTTLTTSSVSSQSGYCEISRIMIIHMLCWTCMKMTDAALAHYHFWAWLKLCFLSAMTNCQHRNTQRCPVLPWSQLSQRKPSHPSRTTFLVRVMNQPILLMQVLHLLWHKLNRLC